ncbi:hypothetical protein PRIPAC_86219 [Pristionchus pacificus]|uniref:Uncharacterized protein n=1 Tax=Pristionchus pacificus TaxID=54126 RepID=A0A2A6BLE2_PRIPA|nr:hypothetical protein PRIPAC_86219 [Pristionchus pacificus]|eukprot:PDM66633.1 hypothetical protein PRIPAC_48050 [Pristionchus pacificus]
MKVLLASLCLIGAVMCAEDTIVAESLPTENCDEFAAFMVAPDDVEESLYAEDVASFLIPSNVDDLVESAEPPQLSCEYFQDFTSTTHEIFETTYKPFSEYSTAQEQL